MFTMFGLGENANTISMNYELFYTHVAFNVMLDPDLDPEARAKPH
jgi:hypothetical protein